MFGWRAKIGVVLPSNNTVLEPEWWSMAPSGVSIHSARILTSGTTAEEIIEMERNALRAVSELKAGGVDSIAYACLATSLVKGVEWSRAFMDSVVKTSSLPTTTAASATVEALQALNVSRVALATPYPHEINDLLPRFLKVYGIEVVSIRNLNVSDVLAVCEIPAASAYKLAKEVDCPEAEAVVILATDFQTVSIIDPLEEDLGKPVVTTNQALLWRCLQLSGVRGPLGYGVLLGRGKI